VKYFFRFFEKMDEFLTRAEAAKFLGISTRTLDRFVKNKILPTHRDGRRKVFLKADLLILQKSAPGQKAEIAAEKVDFWPAEKPEKSDFEKFEMIFEKLADEIRRKDEMIFRLNFEIGAAREREKSMTPLLESGKKNAEKIQKLEKQLFSVRIGRALFFGLFAAAIGAIAILVHFLFWENHF